MASFGTNPGNLNMYEYIPSGISGPAPLVVALHGCTQNAITYATETGWNTMADRHKFYVIYPEQNSANNSSNCFNWFQTGDQDRNQGEAYSVKQMVDHLKSNFSIDTTRIFVTGLSAGGAMTSVMMACYPDVFAKGAVMAGTPYKSATNSSQAFNVMSGFVTNTPANWAALVTNEYPGYTGTYPALAVFHGSSDNVVSIVNENELMKQWSQVRGADQTADITMSSFNGNAFVTKNIYNDNNGIPAVETYTISGMAHGITLDTGACYQQCGKTGSYAYEVLLSSTFFAAYFFDIVTPPYSISGPTSVTSSQNGVTYSVAATSGSAYTWAVPAGASVVSGQGTSQVTVNFGTSSGYVEVTETQSNNCKNGPVKLFVNVGSNGIALQNEELEIVQVGKNLIVRSKSDQVTELSVSDVMGRMIIHQDVRSNEPVDLSGFSGMHVAIVKTKNRTLAKKLLLHN